MAAQEIDYGKINASIKEAISQTMTFRTASAAARKSLKELADTDVNKLKDTVKKVTNEVENLSEKLDDVDDQLEDLSKVEGINAVTTKHIQAVNDYRSRLESLKNSAEKYKKEMASLESQMKSLATVQNDDGKQKEELQKKMDALEKSYRATRREVADTAKSIEDLGKTTKDLSDSAGEGLSQSFLKSFDLIGSGAGGIGNVFKGLGKSPSGFINGLKDAKAKSGELVKGAGTLKGITPLLDMAAGAAKGLGMALGGVAKIFSGPVGLVLFGLMQLVKAVAYVDSYVKTMNKNFAKLRGPEIFSGDVSKQFMQFNRAMMNVHDNIQQGLQPEEVYNFMEAVTAAGVRVTTLNKGILGYRDVTMIAAKASKVFGMDIQQAGAIMGKLMTDYRMQLGDMDDAFAQISFDAQKSGLSTDRFWGAVENASASLSMYGVFIKGVAKTVKDFTAAQVSGAKEAESASTDMTQMFSKNSLEANMAFVEMARRGGADFKDEFSKAADDVSSQITKRADEIQKLEAKFEYTQDPGIGDQIEKLRKQQLADQGRLGDIKQAINGTTMQQAQMLPYISSKGPKLMLNMIKGIHAVNLSSNVTGNNLEIINKALTEGQLQGISKEDVQVLLKTSLEQANSFRDVVGFGAAGEKNDKSLIKWMKKLHILTKMDGAEATDQANNMDDIMSKIEKGMTPGAAEDAAKSLVDLTGMSGDQAETLVKSLSADDAMKNRLQGLINGVKDGTVSSEEVGKLLEEQLKGDDIAYKMQVAEADRKQKDDAQVRDAYDDTFKKIKEQTLSLEDVGDISKKGIKFESLNMVYQSGIYQGVSKTADAAEKMSKGIDWLVAGNGESKKARKKDEDKQEAAQREALKSSAAIYKSITGKDVGRYKVEKDKESGKDRLVYDPKDAAYAIMSERKGQQEQVDSAENMENILTRIESKTDPKIKDKGFSKQMSLLKNIITGTTRVDSDASKETQEAIFNLAKKSAKSDVTGILEKIKVEQDKLRKAIKTGNKQDKEDAEVAIAVQEKQLSQSIDPDKFNAQLQVSKKTTIENKDKARKNVVQLDESITELRESKKISQGVLDIMAASAVDSEGGRKGLLSLLVEEFGKGQKLDTEQLKETALGNAKLEAARKAGWTAMEGGKEVINLPNADDATERLRVVKPGAIELKKDESILPAKPVIPTSPAIPKPTIPFFDMKAPTIPGKAGPAGTMAGRGITISVNATSTDLAEKIAVAVKNQVRGVLYEEQVG